MKALATLLAACIMPIAAVLLEAQASEPEFVELRRLKQWSNATKSPELVHTTYARIDRMRGDGPGSWVYEWSKVGEYFASLGAQFEAKEHPSEARAAYLKAASFYGIARFPAKTLAGQEEAYQKHLHAYQKAGEYFDPPLKVLRIPYRDGHVIGYLHLPPKQDEAAPLIIWNNGIDTWKGDINQFIHPFVNRGFAVLTFDVLGTGESSHWVGRPDSTDVHGVVIDYVQTIPELNGQRIAYVGFSFSGYYAARLAITEPRLFAVISACGPVHQAWYQMYDNAPWEVREAIARTLHLSPDDPARIKQELQKFSLVNQGLLNGPNSVDKPLLIVNGDLDPLVPVEDMQLLANSGQQTDLWIMGGDAHCFGQYRPIALPKMAEWLQQRLQELE